jgi:hypothetical protein
MCEKYKPKNFLFPPIAVVDINLNSGAYIDSIDVGTLLIDT